MEEYVPHHHRKGKKAIMMFVFGLVIILARLYTTWDIWVVVGAMMILKAVFMVVMSLCCHGKDDKCCQGKVEEKKV